nr:hypothetical protein [Tanacetum cinerariifolium]
MMVMIVNNSFRLSMNRNQVTIRTMMCQPITFQIDFSGSDQIQTPQYPEIHFSSQETSNEVFQANHSIQNEESFDPSNEIAVSNSNQEKEEPSQESDFHQLIEECSAEVSEKQKMEDTMLELVKICQEKEFLCIHDDIEDLIKSALDSKLLLINSNSQHLDKKEVVHKSSISFRNTSQISSIHVVAPILSTKEPEHLLSLGYEHLSITLETKSDEVTESNAKNLLPIPSECEVALEDKMECDLPISENSPICDNHSDIDDDISVYDDDFEDIEYVEASLSDHEIVDVEEENVVQQEEEEIDLEDISQIQDIVLREKLLSITRLISNIEYLNNNSTLDRVFNSFGCNNSLLDNFSSEFETFYDHSEETRSEADLFLAADNSILPSIENVADDPEGDIHFMEELLINDSILSHESFDSNFEDNPSIPRPPPEPPDKGFDFEVKISVIRRAIVKFECIDARVKFDVFNDENDVLSYFMFVIFAKEFSLLSAESEDTIFDPGISD